MNELKDDGSLLLYRLLFSSSTPSCPETHTPPPPPLPQLLVVSHVAVMLLLFTTGRLTLIFALPWLSVLCWLLFTSCPPVPRPPLSPPLSYL